MAKKERGFAYMLTNPGLRKNRVKIGHSINPFQRAKVLSTPSGVSDDYEVYAAIKTIKYPEVERFIQNTFTLIAKKHHKKEFFNVKPEKVFEYMKDIETIVADAKLYPPEKISSLREKLKKQKKVNKSSKKTTKIESRFDNFIKGKILTFKLDEKIKIKFNGLPIKYQKKLYSSFSEIAIELAGYRCSGPAFFKYKDKSLAQWKKELDGKEAKKK